jgi:nitroimidazol reductase NimA-like FMN-containing flavoprotein (pyridoxamine 5'-phosphate oxidase superfamily)
MTEDPIHDYEDVTTYTLDEATEDELLAAQNECTFIWANKEGWPVGVIMSYVFRDGRFWLTASSQRKRISAVRRDPRVSVVVSNRGTKMEGSRTVTYKGRCVLHEDDTQAKAWFYPALAEAINPTDGDRAARFARFLDSPRRLILEIVPEQRIGYDGVKMREATSQSPAFLDA